MGELWINENSRVFITPTLSSLVVQEIVIMTTSGAMSDYKVGIMTALDFQLLLGVYCECFEARVPTVMKLHFLTHWGRVTHICFSKLTIIGSDNGLSPDWRPAIISTNDEILLIGILGTNFSEILIEIRIFSLKKMGLKVLSAKWWPCCLGLNGSMMLFIMEPPSYPFFFFFSLLSNKHGCNNTQKNFVALNNISSSYMIFQQHLQLPSDL